MTEKDRTALHVAAAVTVVFTLVVGLSGVGWWVGPAVCLPLVVGSLVVRHRLAGEPADEPADVEPLPPPPPAQPNSLPVRDLALPSADADYRVLLHATVLWRVTTVGALAGAERWAVELIRERASQLTRHTPAGDHDLLAPEVAAALAVPVLDRSGRVEAWAQDVALTLREDDLRRLRRVADLRKDQAVWELERERERSLRAYLRDDVLSSTGSALVWWLARNPTRVERAVTLIGALARLSAAAHDRDVDPLFRSVVDQDHDLDEVPDEDVVGLVGRLVDEVLPGASEPERADLADRLATVLTELDADEAARAVRVAFNAPDLAGFDDPEAGSPATRFVDEGEAVPEDNRTEDVIDLLCRQHEQIRQLFADLEQAPAGEREAVFRDLVRLLSVHETAEQELVHPEIRAMAGGAEIVDARVAEEHRATELLVTLTEIGVDAEGFDTLLTQLREDVLAHAAHEESAEFPILRRGQDRERLVSLAGAVRAAERIAPTRPHPNVEGAAANLVFGPPLAIMDRARDAIRAALRR